MQQVLAATPKPLCRVFTLVIRSAFMEAVRHGVHVVLAFCNQCWSTDGLTIQMQFQPSLEQDQTLPNKMVKCTVM